MAFAALGVHALRRGGDDIYIYIRSGPLLAQKVRTPPCPLFEKRIIVDAVQTALQSTAALESTKDELRATLTTLSSPHRSQTVAALCETLNKTETRFPGTGLRMRFAVAGCPQNDKNGQVSDAVSQEF